MFNALILTFCTKLFVRALCNFSTNNKTITNQYLTGILYIILEAISVIYNTYMIQVFVEQFL